ncbi:MAG: hypothetical protein A2157_18845 [Deltaproteobacteria bacterium RBG_16_47_11]|nr:MAG: hypothetical protein A2157_18845 [Deltaproteobacteria bacterium RBG_16_47_11]
MISKIIKTEKDYDKALVRINDLMDADPGTPEGGELELLVTLVELYDVYSADFGQLLHSKVAICSD